MSEQTSYVVVGGGLAGAKAVEAIRAADPDGTITLVGAESRRPYERPDLSKAVIGGKKSPDDLFVHEEGWYADHDVELVLGQRATGLDRERQVVTLADGRELPYDRLLLATGASPRMLNVPGADLPGVHYLRTAEDAQALTAAIGGRLVGRGRRWRLDRAGDRLRCPRPGPRRDGCRATTVSALRRHGVRGRRALGPAAPVARRRCANWPAGQRDPRDGRSRERGAARQRPGDQCRLRRRGRRGDPQHRAGRVGRAGEGRGGAGGRSAAHHRPEHLGGR